MIAELIAHFTPENFGEWCREQFDRFTSDLHPVADSGGFDRADIVGYIQSLPDADTNRPLLVMAVHAGANINERSSRRRQFEFARQQIQNALERPPAKVKGLFTQGLFAFYDDAGNFRLSLITGRAEGRRLAYGDLKRQSFFVAPDRENKTFRARMASPFCVWKNLVEAFSVETLTKEFYKSLFAWYERAMDPTSKVSFPNELARGDDDRHMLSEHLIRLITRLMFVWFIRQKKLVPKELFDTGDLRQLLARFDPLSPKQDNYYRAILQNLFFATLNCEIGEREFAIEGTRQQNKEHYGIKILYRYQDEFACPTEKVKDLFRTVPFLNGGLFECLDKKHGGSPRSPVIYHDGFSREPTKRAYIPNSLFFDELGLVTLFSRYDFTVDENSPNDADVALDPELLGKVFENLLGAYNPETRQTARKQSGSFYTPREIVNYMVDESLKAHLLTKVGQVFLQRIEALFAPDEQDVPFTDNERHKLVKVLYGCRILDPACGSGAFPMGVLRKMVQLLQRLDPKNALWHEVVMAEVERDLAEAEAMSDAEKADRRRRITESFDQSVNQPDYARKLYLIENCIYGVDIQSIAVQIAKLRAFITLVCDQTPTAVAEKNYGMLPLPNLETKFVAANTLLGLTTDFADGLKTADGVSLLNDPALHCLRAGLAEVRHRHFRARNAPEKNKCRKLDNELRGKIKGRLVDIAAKPNADKIALWQAEIGKRHQQRKEVEKEDWREVVQTKPAQTELFETAPRPVQTTMRMDVNKERRDRIDDDIRRFTRDIEVEQNRAKNKGAFQHEADRLAAWDPYDQNASSPFFDPEWMFDVKDGFDIVIGNPPYVRADDPSEFNRRQREAIMASGVYETLWEKWDLFVAFIERGFRLLQYGGVMSMIVSDAFCHSKYAQKPQNWFLRNARILRLDFCSDIKIFDAAVHNLIYFFQKADGARNRPNRRLHVKEFGNVTELTTDEQQGLTYRVFFPEGKQDTAYDVETVLLESVSYISKGMVVHAEERQARGKFELRNLVSDVQDKNHSKWFVEGKDLDRWLSISGKWLEWGTKRAPGLFSRPTFSELYTVTEKVLIHRTSGQELRSAYDSAGTLCNHTVMVCVPWHMLSDVRNNSLKKTARYKDEKPPRPDLPQREELEKTSRRFAVKYLLAVMNSPVAREFLRANRRSNTDLYPNDWKKLPIPDAAPGKQAEIVCLVDQILDAKRKNANADIGVYEIQVYRMVTSLYGLTPDESAIVEGRAAGGKKAAVSVKPATGAKKTRKSILTEDPDLA